MAITIPNSIVAGTKIEAAPVNANFAETANAVDKRGDTLTGNLNANAGITVDGVDVSTIPNLAGIFNPLFAQIIIGSADTNGIRLDLESGTLAVREGDDSAYGPLITGLLTTSGNHVPASNDGGALGTSSLGWSDLFLATGAVVNFANGDVTISHSTNTLTFGGATSGYIFTDGPMNTATTISVGAATPAATGAGITFPASQSASSDANTLDDYEEGTFTATLRGSTTDPTTPVTTTGYYTKIGRQVSLVIAFQNINTTGAAGNVSVTGMPFAPANVQPVGSASCQAFTTGTSIRNLACTIITGSTTLSFYGTVNNGSLVDLAHSAGAARFLFASITYFV